MAKKKKTRGALRKNPPRGWIKASAVKITRSGGRVKVMVKKPGRKARRR
jgi:hypothetical protein